MFSMALVGAYIFSAVYISGATAAPPVPVGAVDSTKGKVWGETTWRTKYDKNKGDIISKDEVIATGYKSSATITFKDHTILKLGANAKMAIDEMVYNPLSNENDSVVFQLTEGAFYFVSGKVAKKNVSLITPTVVIGIRGTELLINVKPNGATSVGVTKGRAFVHSRENNSSTEISLGSTAHTDAKGNVSDAREGLDLTGDKDVDNNVEGVSDWHGPDDVKKDDSIAEFADDKHDAYPAGNEGDSPDGEFSDGQYIGENNGKITNDGNESDRSLGEGDQGDGASSDEGSSDGVGDGGDGSDGGGDGGGGDGSDGGGDGGDGEGGGSGAGDGGASNSGSGHSGGDSKD